MIIPPETFPNKSVALVPWLKSLGIDTRDLTEDECRKAAQPPDPTGCERLEKVTAIVIHHSATTEGGAEAFRLLHRVFRGWRDVGYHFIIGNGTHTADGMLETGRPELCRGAHAKGANEFSIGVCLVGNFMTETPTSAQMKTLGGLLASLTANYGLEPGSILLHRQVTGSSTECPGKNLTLPMVREALEKHGHTP